MHSAVLVTWRVQENILDINLRLMTFLRRAAPSSSDKPSFIPHSRSPDAQLLQSRHSHRSSVQTDPITLCAPSIWAPCA
ncbi:hypothetical protein VTI74DRAFT_8451 [Chaetomium olivicolor]